MPPAAATPPTPPSADSPFAEEPDEEVESSAAAELSPFTLLRSAPPSPAPLAASAPTAPVPSVPPPVPPAPPVPPVPPVPSAPPAPSTPSLSGMQAPLAPPPAPPVAPKPPTGSPLDDDIDSDALLAHAATAPTQPFILPNRQKLPGPGAPAEQPNRSLEEFVAPDRAAEAAKLATIPVEHRTAAERLPEEAIAAAPLPKEEIAVPIQRKVPPAFGERADTAPPVALPTPPAPPTSPKQAAIVPPLAAAHHARKTNPLLAVLGMVLAVGLLGGGLFVLALSGARIPFLSSSLSGLQGNLNGAMAQASSFVAAQGSYRWNGISEVAVVDETSPTLPDGTPAVYGLKSEVKDGLVTDGGARFMAHASVSANDAPAVPMTIRTGTTEWYLGFPANVDTAPARMAATDLDDTLLAPVVRAFPLETLLAAVRTEQAYEKVSVNQKPAAAYQVSLAPEQLQAMFPKDSIIQELSAVVALAWASDTATAGEPLDVQLTATFRYQERTYRYTSHWQYLNWGEQAPGSEELIALATTDPATVATVLSTEGVVARLGITFNALPHGGGVTSGLEEEPAGFTPIIPSGDVITVIQNPRTGNPPVPVQPASTEAKDRDLQRKQDLQDIKKAIDQYKLVTGDYPFVTGEVQLGSDATLFGALVPNYLTKMPVDPLNSTYFYTYNVVTGTGGSVTGYYIRSILEDHADPAAVPGSRYSYYQLTN